MSPHGPRMVGRSAISGLPEPQEKLAEGLRALKGLGPYLWPRDSIELRVRVVLAMALLIAGKLVNITVPLFYKQAVDALSGAGTAGAVIAVPVGLILAYGLARVTSQGFNELRNGVFAKVAQRAVRRIALSAFRHIHSLSLRFHLDRRTGGLARAVERGIAGIEFLLSFMLFNVIPTLFEILVVSAILWRLYNWQFAAVTLATIVTYIGFTFVITDWRVRFRREMNERNSDANTKSVDSLLNYETVKYFANEEHEAQRYDRALQAYERAAVKSETTLALLNVGQGGIIASGLIGIMLLAGQGVAAGEMTVGDFVLVNAYLIQLYMPLNFLGMVYRNIKQSLTDIEQMMGLLKIRPEIEDQDIRDVTQDSLRRAIGVVPQDTVLFNDTIYYNIAYGRPGAGRAEIEEAARLAHIHDFIAALPDGYQTMVGERGLKLSGGEKQRVAIARVILKAPKILIFDEATSALDTKTEREIQASLAEVAAGHTTLAIAHRLSTVVDADQILVIEAGRIVERGHHRELLARGGVYAEMWARQQEAARLEVEGGEPAFAAK